MKKSAQTSIHISVAKQRLLLKRGRKTERVYPVSTSRFGLGSDEGSMKTPLGRFRIAEKIGGGNSITTAYKSREPVPVTPALLESEDLIMSRILWLEGLEPQNANTHARYIYIHGTNHEDEIGQPASHGCIRMRNADVAELFDFVEIGTAVTIAAPALKRPNGRGEKTVARKERPA